MISTTCFAEWCDDGISETYDHDFGDEGLCICKKCNYEAQVEEFYTFDNQVYQAVFSITQKISRLLDDDAMPSRPYHDKLKVAQSLLEQVENEARYNMTGGIEK